jgi:hypothetical protein
MRNVSYRNCRGNQNTHFMYNNFFFRKSHRLRDNVENIVDPDSSQITMWPKRIAYWIPKAIDTHSEYRILIALSRKQGLHERASLLHYICIVWLVFSWRHTKIRIKNWYYTGRIYKNAVQTWSLSSAHQNKKNCSYQCTSANSFRGTAYNFAQHQSFVFLSMGTLESLVYSPPIGHEETLYKLTLAACQTFVTAPVSVTGCDYPSSYVVMRSLIPVEEIVRIFCGLWLHKL